MKKILFSMIFASTILVAYGQGSDFAKLTEILPPAPEAAALGKFGGINPSLSTGAMAHSIQLYSYKSRDIQFPISINYYSNGVKVDEIASRMGTSWTMNAGGVITHTVFGKNDLTSTRLNIPTSYPSTRDTSVLNFFNAINSPIEDGGFSDTEPDVFSFNFNGFNGRFILDSALNPVLLDYSNLKIEFVDIEHFKITDGEGIQYFFGGTNAIELSNKISSGACGKSYYDPIITAWNLSMIVHPNLDTVWFNYTQLSYSYLASISETIFNSMPNTLAYAGTCSSNGIQPPPMVNKNCETHLRATVSLLHEILSSAGPYIQFAYIGRSDISDEKLFDSLNIYSKNKVLLFKSIRFGYQSTVPSKRPFLTEIVLSDGAKYKFSYNDINSVPAYLSYSKDHYGYFNGKPNPTLISVPEDPTWKMKLPQATADREPVEEKMIKGSLSKITYPTGGSDSIIYEGNQLFSSQEILPPQVNISKSSYSDAWPGETVASSTFTISYSQQTELIVNCTFSGLPSDDDPLHNKGTLVIKNSVGSEVYSKQVNEGQNFFDIIYLTADNYTVYFKASGNKVTFGGTFTYRNGIKTQQYLNRLFSGIRVRKVITKDKTGKSQTKNFLYSKLESPENSSFNTEIWKPDYQNLLKVYVPCNAQTDNPGAGMEVCDVAIYQFYSMSSSTLNNIYLYNSPVAYSSVIESFGDSFQNGGIEHHFTVMPNAPGGAYFGDFILGAPMIDNSWINGKEIYTSYFKKENFQLVSLKRIYTNLKVDNRVDTLFKAIVLNKKYIAPCTAIPPLPEEFDAWDCPEYWHNRKWVYPDSIRTQIFNPDGQSFLENTIVTEYDNPLHTMMTRTEINDSKDGVIIEKKKYLQDYSNFQSNSFLNNLFLLHATGIPIEELEIRKNENGNQFVVAGTITRYKNIGGRVLMDSILQLEMASPIPIASFQESLINSSGNFIKDGHYQPKVCFDIYDLCGKILQLHKTNNVFVSYLWDYQNSYPIAEATNASQSDIAYSSFEADGKGNWTFSGAPGNIGGAVTGKQSYPLGSGPISRSGLTSAKKYIISYWSKGSVSVSGGTQTNPITGKTVNGWTYHEVMVTGTTNVSLSGGTYIDELRLYPSDAQMTTYTYEPLIGMTSQCGVDSKIQYYEYDTFGRLQDIKDPDGNIIKTFEYHYQQNAQ